MHIDTLRVAGVVKRSSHITSRQNMMRGRGYIQSVRDVENIAMSADYMRKRPSAKAAGRAAFVSIDPSELYEPTA